MTFRLPILVASVLAAAALAATGNTIVVDVGGSGDYIAIGPALTACSDGDTILVKPGTYSGTDNHDLHFSGKNVLLRSEGGSAATILHGDGSGRIFKLFASDAGPGVVVEDFTLTGGDGFSGGLIYIVESSPTFTDCVFSNSTAIYGGAAYLYGSDSSFTNCVFNGNSSQHGGAMQIERSSPAFTNCQFTLNSSTGEAGGVDVIWEASPTFSSCTFSGNTAGSNGGGLRCYDHSSPSVTNCDFIENDASLRGGGAFSDSTSTLVISYSSFEGNTATVGGGLSSEGNSSASVSGTVFVDNDGGNGGGGVYTDFASATFYSCYFYTNTAYYGGGAYCYESTSSFNTCIFYGNAATSSRSTGGGGLYLDQVDATLTYVTLSDNGSDDYAGGVNCYQCNPTFENCIIAFSTSGPAITCESGTETVSLTCCDIFGNAGGDWTGCISGQSGMSGNISSDPLFCDRPNGVLTIDAASPCAPDHSGGCGVIGAMYVDCDSAVEQTSWGAIKAQYR